MNLQNTIVALATPPGIGALGIIRLSGPDAIAIADTVFRGKRLADQQERTLHFGKIMDGDTVLDEVVVSLFRGPRSYTGEDVVEISCHGSQYILQQVINVCLRAGAMPARPGEFTFRAFLKGKLDLTQAEAVADLIASQSSSARRSAMNQLRGGFSHTLKAIRDQLIQFSALIELELDFSQEDVEFADRSRLYQLIDEALATTRHLVESFRLGNVVKHGVSVAIIGKPNAGKSTLLNALLGEERAIVSDIAGTTRDTIEEVFNINGVLFRLIDTAGIREHAADTIEEQGIFRSRKKAEEADIIVYVFDQSAETPDSLQPVTGWLRSLDKPFIIACNKMDLQGSINIFNTELPGPTVFLRAREGEGIPELKQAIYDHTVDGTVSPDQTIVTNTRHLAALEEVQQSLLDIKAGMDGGLPGDLLALDIRRCLHFIGEITGEVTTEDKLDYIFSKFCIGK